MEIWNHGERKSGKALKSGDVKLRDFLLFFKYYLFIWKHQYLPFHHLAMSRFLKWISRKNLTALLTGASRLPARGHLKRFRGEGLGGWGPGAGGVGHSCRHVEPFPRLLMPMISCHHEHHGRNVRTKPCHYSGPNQPQEAAMLSVPTSSSVSPFKHLNQPFKLSPPQLPQPSSKTIGRLFIRAWWEDLIRLKYNSGLLKARRVKSWERFFLNYYSSSVCSCYNPTHGFSTVICGVW